jgi:hypothetical protein
MRIVIGLFAVLMSTSAYAGRGGGGYVSGGGNGIEVDSTLRLYDLVENDATALISTPRSRVFESPFREITWMSERTKEVLGSKLQILSDFDPALADASVRGILHYKWYLEVSRLTHIDGYLGETFPESVVPIAVRRFDSVIISVPAFNRLSYNDQAALVLHEVLAALENPAAKEDLARKLVAAIFSTTDLSTSIPKSLKNQVLAFWPTVPLLISTHVMDRNKKLLTSSNFQMVDRCPVAICPDRQDQEPSLSRSWEVRLFPYQVESSGDGVVAKYFDADLFHLHEYLKAWTALQTDSKKHITMVAKTIRVQALEPHTAAKLAVALTDAPFMYFEIPAKPASPNPPDALSESFALVKFLKTFTTRN